MQNLVLAIQNDRADSADQDSGLREDSARLRKCCPGHTEQKRALRGLGLRTPRGLREAPKVLPWPHRTEAHTPQSWTPDSARTPRVLAWPHRMEARTPRSWTPASARTPRGSESAGLATQHGSAADSAIKDSDSARLGTSSVVVVVATSSYIARLAKQGSAASESPGGWRVHCMAVLLTYNGITDLKQWRRFLKFVRSEQKNWNVRHWCATLEASKKGTYHIHLMLQFTKTVDRNSRSFAFEAIRPNCSPNGAGTDLLGSCIGGRNPQKSVDRGMFYVWADKVGTVRDEKGDLCVGGNYFPCFRVSEGAPKPVPHRGQAPRGARAEVRAAPRSGDRRGMTSQCVDHSMHARLGKRLPMEVPVRVKPIIPPTVQWGE